MRPHTFSVTACTPVAIESRCERRSQHLPTVKVKCQLKTTVTPGNQNNGKYLAPVRPASSPSQFARSAGQARPRAQLPKNQTQCTNKILSRGSINHRVLFTLAPASHRIIFAQWVGGIVFP